MKRNKNIKSMEKLQVQGDEEFWGNEETPINRYSLTNIS